MRAYMVDRPEGEFRAVDLPRPVPAAGQVLVRVMASGINPLDTKIRAGKAAHAQQPLPAVLGLDMAGLVEDPGPAQGMEPLKHGRCPAAQSLPPASRHRDDRQRHVAGPSAVPGSPYMDD